MSRLRVVGVGRGRERYPVHVGAGALSALPALLAERGLAAHRPVILADAAVERLHGERVRGHLPGPPAALTLTFPSGEREKTRERWAALTDEMLAAGCGRDTVVLALGGGVAGDLAGFVAATFLRGVPVVQLPTTLLAMVDASVGGKTGVDAAAGKNLVGAFHPPAGVVADLDLLRTLPERELRGGIAEAIKHGALADPAYLRRTLREAGALLRAEAGPLGRLVTRSVRIKARLVGRDLREGGERALLNLGHTLAHALETETGYAVPHGEAVAIGLVAEARVGERLGVTAGGTAARLEEALRAVGLPVRFPAGTDAEAIVRRAAHDKKNRGGEIRLVLLREIGRPLVEGGAFTHAVDPSLLRAVVAESTD